MVTNLGLGWLVIVMFDRGLNWLVIRWTTARLARDQMDHGLTGSWAIGPRLDWLVGHLPIQSDLSHGKGILKRLWRALKSLQTVVRN